MPNVCKWEIERQTLSLYWFQSFCLITKIIYKNIISATHGICQNEPRMNIQQFGITYMRDWVHGVQKRLSLASPCKVNGVARWFDWRPHAVTGSCLSNVRCLIYLRLEAALRHLPYPAPTPAPTPTWREHWHGLCALMPSVWCVFSPTRDTFPGVGACSSCGVPSWPWLGTCPLCVPCPRTAIVIGPVHFDVSELGHCSAVSELT